MRSNGQSSADKRFNFAACLTDAVGWPLGAAFFSTSTILPVLLRHLGAGDLAVGSLAALYNILLFLPGFLLVGTLHRRRRARGLLFWIAIGERLALLPLVWLTPLWALSNPRRLIESVFCCIAVHASATGINQPVYWTVISKTIPVHWRGRLFGAAGGLAGLLGLGVGRILNRLLGGPNGGFPQGFATAFLVGFAILTISVLPLGIVREPNQEPAESDDFARGAHETKGNEGPRHVLKDSLHVWRTNAPFRRFLRAQCLFQFSSLALPFFVLAAAHRAHAGAHEVAGYTATLVLASAFGNVIWGSWADRSGNRKALLAASLCAVAGGALALLAWSTSAYYAVYALTALGGSGVWLTAVNITMEYAKAPRAVPLYTTIYNAVTSVPRAAAPLIGGLIASVCHGYQPVFAVATAAAAASLLLAVRATDPRHAAA